MNDMKAYHLHRDPLPANVGNKAKALQFLRQNGIAVPNGYVLDSSFLNGLLRENGRLEEFRALCSGDVVINRCRKLQSMILSLQFSDEQRRQAEEITEEFGHDLIVRSSSENEDSAESSMAGMYESIGGIHTADALCKAVLECFSSAYSQGLLNISGRFDENMSLIIQEYVPAVCAGIAFTVDPVQGRENTVCINYGEDVSRLTDGSAKGHVLYLDKTEPEFPEDLPRPALFRSLYETLKRAETLFQYPIDCEWCFTENGVMMIQTRPVTSIQPKRYPDVIDLDRIADLNGVELGRLRVANDKWFAKKYYVRKQCKDRGIPVYAARYILLSDDPQQRRKAVAEAASAFVSAYIEAYDGTDYTVMRTEELSAFCEECYARSGAGYLRVCEYWVGLSCGYAAVTADSHVYIETVKGSFYGMWVGGLKPSCYALSAENCVISRQEAEMPFYYALSPDTLKYEKNEPPVPVLHTLSDEALQEIAALSRTLCLSLGNVNVEWLATPEGIRIFDLSEGNQTLTGQDCTANVLSRGNAEGTAAFADDISVLCGLFDNALNDIDVVPTKKYMETVESDACENAVRQLLRGQEKPIVIADFPDRALAVLCGHVSGFIFRRGAMLCHLSIILREKQIPAVICPEICDLVKQGETLSICGDRVIVSRPAKKGRKIILEGTCCVGKSTVLNYLRETNKFQIMDENIVMADFPNRDIKSEQDSLERDMYFLNLDIRKWAAISDLQTRGDVIVERCSLGTLAITYSSADYHGNLSEMCRTVLNQIDRHAVPVPDAFVYLTKPYDLLKQHYMKDHHGVRIEHWNHLEAFETQDRFLKQYFAQQTAVPVLHLENLGAEEVSVQIQDFLEQLEKSSSEPDRLLFEKELRAFLCQFV